jgi:hypothetical protein
MRGIPHHINEDKSDMRGIKSGWYAIADDGTIISGPFFNQEDCLRQIARPSVRMDIGCGAPNLTTADGL